MRTPAQRRRLCLTLALDLSALLPAAPARAPSPAQVDGGHGAQQLLARRTAPLRRAPGVAIDELRSGVPEAQVAAAQEMFVTALVRSGAFAVAERQRLSEGVMRERQLAQQGVSGAAAGQVVAAHDVFEPVPSEANAGANESAQGIRVGGMRVQTARAADSIGLDVRIDDAAVGRTPDACAGQARSAAAGPAAEGRTTTPVRAALHAVGAEARRSRVALTRDVATDGSRPVALVGPRHAA